MPADASPCWLDGKPFPNNCAAQFIRRIYKRLAHGWATTGIPVSRMLDHWLFVKPEVCAD